MSRDVSFKDWMNPKEERASKEVVDARMEICNGCEFFSKRQQRCKKCHCFMKLKTELARARCPEKKW